MRLHPCCLVNGKTNNFGSIDVPYDSYCGEVTVPTIADIMATDDCGATAVCDSTDNAEANAAIADALGAGILGADGHLDLLTSVTTTGVNNPFVTGGESSLGTIATLHPMADGETCDNNPNAHGMRMFNFAGGEYYITEWRDDQRFGQWNGDRVDDCVQQHRCIPS